MNSYGTTRQLATKLVTGEQAKPVPAKARIVRTSRHFSAMTGTEKCDGGLNRYNQLASDPIPRDIKSGSNLTAIGGKHQADTESLLTSRYHEPIRNGESISWQSYNGFRYTPSAEQLASIRRANSTGHLLNPTGGNVCGKCGYDTYCKCPLPIWAGGQPVTLTPKLVSVLPIPNGGVWLRGTKLYAILP